MQQEFFAVRRDFGSHLYAPGKGREKYECEQFQTRHGFPARQIDIR
jgi:hypothetical protein